MEKIKNYRKFVFVIIGGLTVVYFIIAYFVVFKKYINDNKNELCYNSYCFDIEIANTNTKRKQGLMNTKNIPNDYGMLFVFDENKKHSFWMKNTLIPLDIIWLDENYKVVDFTTMQPCKNEPCTNYTPKAKSKYALEVRGEKIKELGITVGDMLGN